MVKHIHIPYILLKPRFKMCVVSMLLSYMYWLFAFSYWRIIHGTTTLILFSLHSIMLISVSNSSSMLFLFFKATLHVNDRSVSTDSRPSSNLPWMFILKFPLHSDKLLYSPNSYVFHFVRMVYSLCIASICHSFTF